PFSCVPTGSGNPSQCRLWKMLRMGRIYHPQQFYAIKIFCQVEQKKQARNYWRGHFCTFARAAPIFGDKLERPHYTTIDRCTPLGPQPRASGLETSETPGRCAIVPAVAPTPCRKRNTRRCIAKLFPTLWTPTRPLLPKRRS